jgi:hypothetical protein
MCAPFFVLVAEFALRPDLGAYEKLLAPGYRGILTLSALSLPFFVFIASPLLFFAQRGTAARKRAAFTFAASAIVVEALALGIVKVSSPIYGPERRDLGISETIDQDKGRFEIVLKGKQRLGKGKLEREGQSLDYNTDGDRALLSGSDGERRISISASASPFLDRVDERISIAFSRPPYSVDLRLESDEEMLIFDCSLPYKVVVDGRSATIYTGVNPGRLVSFSLTVPTSFRSDLIVTARYFDAQRRRTQSSGTPLKDLGLSVKASLGIGEGMGR